MNQRAREFLRNKPDCTAWRRSASGFRAWLSPRNRPARPALSPDADRASRFRRRARPVRSRCRRNCVRPWQWRALRANAGPKPSAWADHRARAIWIVEPPCNLPDFMTNLEACFRIRGLRPQVGTVHLQPEPLRTLTEGEQLGFRKVPHFVVAVAVWPLRNIKRTDEDSPF